MKVHQAPLSITFDPSSEVTLFRDIRDNHYFPDNGLYRSPSKSAAMVVTDSSGTWTWNPLGSRLVQFNGSGPILSNLMLEERQLVKLAELMTTPREQYNCHCFVSSLASCNPPRSWITLDENEHAERVCRSAIGLLEDDLKRGPFFGLFSSSGECLHSFILLPPLTFLGTQQLGVLHKKASMGIELTSLGEIDRAFGTEFTAIHRIRPRSWS